MQGHWRHEYPLRSTPSRTTTNLITLLSPEGRRAVTAAFVDPRSQVARCPNLTPHEFIRSWWLCSVEVTRHGLGGTSGAADKQYSYNARD
ncbi:hypothetical protein E2C01_024678 [Portunus trituberculatus]|uniref:Uncharacterized protein n=1 Tax=Portunus trituberculatus TaxID=210409 RepID=A0A5B7EAY4_PORTR|nr:hypothetical protein [Portunus trituberculatus]